MSFFIGVLTFFLIINCAVLILLVLVQLPKKDAGAGLAFGGGAADALFGAGSGNALVLTSAGNTATLAEWDAALEAVSYNSTSADPTVGGTEATRNVTWSVTDADNQTSANATSTVDVIAVPTIAVTPHTVAFYQGGSAVQADGTSPTIASTIGKRRLGSS